MKVRVRAGMTGIAVGRIAVIADELDRRGEGATPGVFGDTERVGLWAFLATVTMLFIGFTSSPTTCSGNMRGKSANPTKSRGEPARWSR